MYKLRVDIPNCGQEFYYLEWSPLPSPTRVDHVDRKTTVTWSDGSKTTVRCKDGDTYDPYAGFCSAYVKKMYGSTSAAKKEHDRIDGKTIDTERETEKQRDEEAKARKKQKRERNYVKRMAKQRFLEMKAEEKAYLMLKDWQHEEERKHLETYHDE